MRKNDMRSIELFTGAGGLALGVAEAGFKHDTVVEWDHDSCETLRLNQAFDHPRVKGWKVREADVRLVDYSEFAPNLGLLAGGVPCQPFSLGGKHQAHNDPRDMFPEFIRGVAALKPKAFLIENVKGLLRASFADYFEYVLLRLAHPMIACRANQTWRQHRSELECIHTAGCETDLDYNVVFQLVNAADYGVPQRRERVFVVGFRSDLKSQWSFPEPSHSSDALLHQQWVTGEYWQRHRISRKKRPQPNARIAARVAKGCEASPLFESGLLPWQTVRDAISDLPKIADGETDPNDPHHFINPGARCYAGHTGSPWDEPAKTLKAGDHGVPGGENTLALGDGQVRYFTVRECARLQAFPDDYRFHGSWTETMRQLGNAVPVALAHRMSENIFQKLSAKRA